MKTQPTTALFDDPDEDPTRLLADAFDDDGGNPTEDYAGRAAHVRHQDNDW